MGFASAKAFSKRVGGVVGDFIKLKFIASLKQANINLQDPRINDGLRQFPEVCSFGSALASTTFWQKANCNSFAAKGHELLQGWCEWFISEHLLRAKFTYKLRDDID